MKSISNKPDIYLKETYPIPAVLADIALSCGFSQLSGLLMLIHFRSFMVLYLISMLNEPARYHAEMDVLHHAVSRDPTNSQPSEK